ncbi:MAG: mannonate dehydratase [Dehalococcoidia bacterium]|nr:mannonate dehydratase [Dehalococcoidia bacterium]
MRAGFGQFNQATPEYLRFAQQYGVTDILLNTPGLPSYNGTWSLHDLVKLRMMVESYGMKLSALENVPTQFYDHIMLGGPKRDEQIDNMITTVRNIARAGIPIFGYNWMPSHVWRTPPKLIRGGAVATAFNYEQANKMPLAHGREYGDEEMWENLEYWIKIITPIAEEEGIRLGIHPCDPPVDQLGGVAQLFRSYDNYRRYLDIYPSDNCAIEFCQGTVSEMRDSAGDGIYDFIAEMVRRRKVLYVHFRNVSAPNPEDFHEEFINTGHVDMYRAMKAYHDNGYDSFFIDDHVPHTHRDTEWGHRGRAFANGYIQAMIEAVSKQG